MDFDKYLEGQSMQRPPLFESDSFIYWKNRFETYVKSKNLDLWHVITNGDFQPIEQNPKTKLDEVIPFEKQSDDLKKRLAKNNEAKMCFSRFNTIITSLKALDEGYSSKNYVRKFFRALHPKWRAKVTTIEESKDLTSLSFYELIGNLKVHEMIIMKDSKIVKAKGERRSLALKAKNESNDEECSTSEVKTKSTPWRLETSRGSWSDSGEEDDEKAKDETCLVAQASNEICLGVDLEPEEWIKDSGCSKHMTGNQKLFSTYKAYNGGNVIFGSNLRSNIIGKGQICDNKCRVTFSEHDSEITKDGKVIGRASKELVRNLPKLKFDQHFCDACKIGRQAHASHKAKNIVSTTRCLELLHMDLFGPSAVRSYGGNLYTLVIVDDYSRTDHGREFDNEVQFGEFCNANGITHNFSAPCTPQSNGVATPKIVKPTSSLMDDDLDEEEAIKVTEKKNIENDIEDETLEIDDVVNIKESRNHPLENVIGNFNQRTLRSQAQNQSNFFCFISTIEPKNVNEALTDESWIIVMQEELNQFIANDVWEFVPQPKNMTIIGTKWVFRNKLDEKRCRFSK
ncbi:retrovirus-related pol polyprotein from transposon TNT 1-94 [Tanacetum coccineum]